MRTQFAALAVLMVAALSSTAARPQMQTQTTTPVASQPATQVEGSSTLALIGPTNQSVVLLSAIQAMPHQTVTLTDPHSHASEAYSGVPLIALMQQVGAPTAKEIRGKTLSQYIVATGSDGYQAVISLAEAEPDFHPGQMIVADSMNGKPLDVKVGPLRLIVSEDAHPARSVRNLVKLELRQAQ